MISILLNTKVVTVKGLTSFTMACHHLLTSALGLSRDLRFDLITQRKGTMIVQSPDCFWIVQMDLGSSQLQSVEIMSSAPPCMRDSWPVTDYSHPCVKGESSPEISHLVESFDHEESSGTVIEL